jgi:hypothetical protein
MNARWATGARFSLPVWRRLLDTSNIQANFMENFAEMRLPIVQHAQSRTGDTPFIEITCLEGHIMAQEINDQAGAHVIKEFEALWLRQGGETELPCAQSLAPGGIAGLMPHLMLLKADAAQGEPFRTRLVGAQHRYVAKGVHAGDMLDDVDASHAERVKIAAKTRRLVYWRSGENDGIAIGDCPFSSDGVTVDRIVSVVTGGKPPLAFG